MARKSSPPAENERRISVGVPVNLVRRVKVFGAERGMTIIQIAIEAFTQYLEREERKSVRQNSVPEWSRQ